MIYLYVVKWSKNDSINFKFSSCIKFFTNPQIEAKPYVDMQAMA